MNTTQAPAGIDPAKRDQVRASFRHNGIAIAAWAKANNLSAALVHRVLSGKVPSLRGESHRAAVLLGLKAGAISDASTFNPGASVSTASN